MGTHVKDARELSATTRNPAIITTPTKMPLTIIRSPPSADSYEPLSSFQAATPASFSTPVLHHHEVNAKVLLSRDQASLIPIFLPADSKQGDADAESTDEITVDGIDLWVTNEYVSSVLCSTFFVPSFFIPHSTFPANITT
jgi:hypothetical protein